VLEWGDYLWKLINRLPDLSPFSTILVNSLDSAPKSASHHTAAPNSNLVMTTPKAADDGTSFAVTLVLAVTAIVVVAAALADYLNGIG